MRTAGAARGTQLCSHVGQGERTYSLESDHHQSPPGVRLDSLSVKSAECTAGMALTLLRKEI